ncbi:DUF1972 domain-containing protein [Pseudonocardia sp.]
MIGTRGVPARYGGFETAVEEIGRRLAEAGHGIRVYCRGGDRSSHYLGMRRTRLPALKHPITETLSHTALSVAHLALHRTDVALVFNAANAPLLPVIRASRIPVAVHVDGLEWKRAKWGPNGRRYYLANERLAVRLADELIADAVGIQDYYRDRYNAGSVFIPYGAAIQKECDAAELLKLGLHPNSYHLVVARLEPENHVDVIVKGYAMSNAVKPLIVVGSVPYRSEHEKLVKELARQDSRIRLVGGVWDSNLLDSLYAGAATYLHGHSVGGTNPSLLRAMGAGASVIAWDVNFNREVLGDHARFFSTPAALAHAVSAAETEPDEATAQGEAARQRAIDLYDWDDVATRYESLCRELNNRERVRGHRSQNR